MEKENCHPLVGVGKNIATKYKEKAEVLNAFFDSLFNSKSSYVGTHSLCWKTGTGIRRKVCNPGGSGEWPAAPLRHTPVYGAGGIHPRELAEALTKPLSIICQQPCLTGEVPVDWKSANAAPIYKRGWKEDPGKHRPISLTSDPRKVMKLSAITWQLQDQAQPAWV